MCICINCRHIHKCQTYQFIEIQHGSNVSKRSKFTPIQTVIVVNMNKQSDNFLLDWDLKECTSFIEEPGSWLKRLKSNYY